MLLLLLFSLFSYVLAQAAGGGKLIATGIAVKSLNDSLAFYTSLGLVPRARYSLPEYDEVVLNFPNSKAQSLVLMQWSDGRLAKKPIPVELVLFVQDTKGFEEAVTTAGGEVKLPYGGGEEPGVAEDLDGYTLEFFPLSALPVAQTGNATALIGATTIPAADLGQTLEFYLSVVGLTVQELRTEADSDVAILAFSKGGSQLVIANYVEPREYQDVPIKIVMTLEDPRGWAEHFKSGGGEMILEVAPNAAVGGATVGFGKDLNGVLIEVLDIKQVPGM